MQKPQNGEEICGGCSRWRNGKAQNRRIEERKAQRGERTKGAAGAGGGMATRRNAKLGGEAIWAEDGGGVWAKKEIGGDQAFGESGNEEKRQQLDMGEGWLNEKYQRNIASIGA